MQLILSESWWFILLCLAIGFAYSFLLYKKHFKNKLYLFLAFLRALLVATLCFFLLEPIVIRILNRIEKPKILMVLDNSESIVNSKLNKSEVQNFIKEWYEVKNVLGKDYDVEYLNLGGLTYLSDSVDFKDKKTNLSQMFDFINNSYAKQNIGAVVLASDGIFNRGSNPLYKKLSQHSPLYTIGLGDSSIQKDVVLNDVNSNAIAYLNNDFPVEINLTSFACQNQNSILKISSDGIDLFNEKIFFNSNNFFKNLTVNLPAKKPGTLHLVVSLSPIDGEHSLVNNKKDVFIDIIDGREKVLLVYSGPHPDVGALKEAIQSNQNYEVLSMPLNQVGLSDIKQYSVAILHQVPNTSFNPKNLISALRSQNIPIWAITGSQSFIDQLNLVSSVLRIDKNQGRFNESQAFFNSNFNAFVIEDETKSVLPVFPPLKSPYGQYIGTDQLEVLMYQKIGAVNTNMPLWAFSKQNGEKTAYLFGEGIWKWKLINYAENENHNAVNELINKTIQYLAIKEDKRKFRVYSNKKTYEEDEVIKFYAELYNASYEPINSADVKLSLTNEGQKVFEYNFSKVGKSYQLDLGLLAPGNYTYIAKSSEVNESISGKIIVKPLQTELINTRADFGLLRTLSEKSGGSFLKANLMKDFSKLISNNQSVGNVSYNEKKPDELIQIKWLFFVLMAILTLEWFIRKYEGAY